MQKPNETLFDITLCDLIIPEVQTVTNSQRKPKWKKISKKIRKKEKRCVKISPECDTNKH